MNKDFRADDMKIEGGKWRWMHNLPLKGSSERRGRSRTITATLTAGFRSINNANPEKRLAFLNFILFKGIELVWKPNEDTAAF